MQHKPYFGDITAAAGTAPVFISPPPPTADFPKAVLPAPFAAPLTNPFDHTITTRSETTDPIPAPARPSNEYDTRSSLRSRYQLLQLLGRGGMGSVFEAHDYHTNKTVALKLLSVDLIDSEMTRKRFEHEARISMSLKHRNIVNVYDAGCLSDQSPYIAMERLEGDSLAQILSEHRLELPEFFTIFQQICEGVAFAHSQRVMHRDLKPSNIMIVDHGTSLTVKIIDFGISKQCKRKGEIGAETLKAIFSTEVLSDPALAEAGEWLQRLTQPGEVFGSPLYMSPEQCRGEETDCRSEVYELGCMMFEALTGVAPLKGASALETLIMRRQQHAPTIDGMVPGLRFPAPLVSLVARALAHRPDDRFQSVRELLEAIKAMHAALFDRFAA